MNLIQSVHHIIVYMWILGSSVSVFHMSFADFYSSCGEFLSGIWFYILFMFTCWLLQSHTKAMEVIILESSLQELHLLECH